MFEQIDEPIDTEPSFPHFLSHCLDGFHATYPIEPIALQLRQFSRFFKNSEKFSPAELNKMSSP
jgi:hypothetical protein